MALVDLQPAANLGDDVGHIIDVNDDLEELFRPLQASIDNHVQNGRPSSPKRSRVDELGIDEEVQVKKRRAPVAKLDDDRLLSQNGIPKLRRIAQERFKFKGKGHEFTDIARMLNHYQLWLDDLYPRAKFADGLAIIEKLGHSKRMNVMRKEWIKESKTAATIDTGDIAMPHEGAATIPTGTGNSATARNSPSTGPDQEESLFVDGAELENDLDLPEEDELDALLADASAAERPQSNTIRKSPQASADPDKPGDAHGGFEDQYAEEMRMMAEMENW